jgi:hypothetical protein
VIIYGDSDEDMEDFQIQLKKTAKKVESTKVSFIIWNRNIIHIYNIFWDQILILNSGIWLNFSMQMFIYRLS